MIKWEATKEELLKMSEIYNRYKKMIGSGGRPKMDFIMDIEATHCNGCPIDLDKLLDTPDFDFMHDIAGITNCLDRETGKLKDCFLPRCAAH